MNAIALAATPAQTMLAVLAVHQIAAIAGNQRVCNIISQYAFMGDYYMQRAREWALYFAPINDIICDAESRRENESVLTLRFGFSYYCNVIEKINIHCMYCLSCGEYAFSFRPYYTNVAKVLCTCQGWHDEYDRQEQE